MYAKNVIFDAIAKALESDLLSPREKLTVELDWHSFIGIGTLCLIICQILVDGFL